MSAESLLLFEQVSTVLLILYVILIALEIIWAWPLGIIGSILGAIVFYYSNLQGEAFLYIYYVIAGIYGWVTWSSLNGQSLKISEWPLKTHLILLAIGTVFSFGLKELMNSYFPENQKASIDAITTVFAFIATYMQIKKIQSNWYYWIIVNAITIYLYFNRGLDYFGNLAILYTALSVVGLFSWINKRRKYTEENSY